MECKNRIKIAGSIFLVVLLVGSFAITQESERESIRKDPEEAVIVAQDDLNIANEEQKGGTVIRRIPSDCKTLSWIEYTTKVEKYILHLLYDPLFDITEKLEYVPILAKGYEVSSDRLRITVNLRGDTRWHDGKPITARDFKFTMDKIMSPKVPAINKAAYFEKLDNLEIVDDYTLVFHWIEPYAPFIYALTKISPIPEHIYGDGDFSTHPAHRKPVGSGPFKFDEWRSGQFISLVRNDDYHDKAPYLDRVVFRVVEDDAIALNALKAGDLDEMRVTQFQWEKQTNSDEFNSEFAKLHYYVPNYNYIGWNCKSVWFRDQNVRLAMTKLFNRELINSTIYSGYAKIISGPFYINSWAYDPSIEPHPYDPESAKRLLKEAGWIDRDNNGIRDKDGIEFEFALTIKSGSTTANLFAQLFQEECLKAGIDLQIRQLEGATFFSRVKEGAYDACLLAWRLDLDPDIYDTFHSSQVPPKGQNHGFYHNPDVDSFLEAGRTEFNQKKRAEIYHRVHRIIHDEQPYTFINTVPEKRVINKKIKNVIISPEGPFNFYPGARYWYKIGVTE
jgi:peptide/nickel transport system substrate-binding protein